MSDFCSVVLSLTQVHSLMQYFLIAVAGSTSSSYISATTSSPSSIPASATTTTRDGTCARCRCTAATPSCALPERPTTTADGAARAAPACRARATPTSTARSRAMDWSSRPPPARGYLCGERWRQLLPPSLLDCLSCSGRDGAERNRNE